MKLEDEKRLVATRIMDWKYIPEHDFYLKPLEPSTWSSPKREESPDTIQLGEWNPQEDRNCWDEIWDKMDIQTGLKYLKNLKQYFKDDSVEWDYHTAKPEICWKALIRTLEEI